MGRGTGQRPLKICSLGHCEERSDAAISLNFLQNRDCFAALAMTIPVFFKGLRQGRVLIRKMRPFEESHAFALRFHYTVKAGAWGSVFKSRIG